MMILSEMVSDFRLWKMCYIQHISDHTPTTMLQAPQAPTVFAPSLDITTTPQAPVVMQSQGSQSQVVKDADLDLLAI
jgi:hypothetical protein